MHPFELSKSTLNYVYFTLLPKLVPCKIVGIAWAKANQIFKLVYTQKGSNERNWYEQNYLPLNFPLNASVCCLTSFLIQVSWRRKKLFIDGGSSGIHVLCIVDSQTAKIHCNNVLLRFICAYKQVFKNIQPMASVFSMAIP